LCFRELWLLCEQLTNRQTARQTGDCKSKKSGLAHGGRPFPHPGTGLTDQQEAHALLLTTIPVICRNRHIRIEGDSQNSPDITDSH